jgi:hypothetical protein
MKKLSFIFALIFGLILIGCNSVPDTSSREMIEGLWLKEDGTTFTFSGENWELLSMENGVAGYGTYSFRSKNRVDFRITYFYNLKFPVTSEYPMGKDTRVKNFQIIAQEEYNKLYPENILQYNPENIFSEWGGWGDAKGSVGGALRYYQLDGNELTLTQFIFPPNPTEFIINYDKSMNGKFIKQ